jgi:hypothetical protein
MKHNIRWHRIMCYTGAGLLVLADSNLSRFGFVDGTDYFLFTSIDHLASILSRIFKTNFINDSLHDMTSSMENKISANFNMSILMSNVLKQVGLL